MRRYILPEHHNALRLGDDAPSDSALRIPLRPMEELDFLSREAVTARRNAAVAEHAELLSGAYSPTEAVFGLIESGKPWWGIEGIYHYARGDKSITGPSEETRFFANPLLLVGLAEPVAHLVNNYPVAIRDPYPKPTELELDLRHRTGRVRYDLSGYFAYLKAIGEHTPEQRILGLVGYNARDLGFGYLALDAAHSTGVYWFGKPEEPEALRQFVHTGPSCGYPGGCNNMSPDLPGMRVTFTSLPAIAVFKLWRERPADPLSTAPALTFSLEVVDFEGNMDL